LGGRGNRGIALLSLLLRPQMGGRVVNIMPSPIYSWVRDTVLLLQEAEWASEPRSGLVGKISLY